MTADDNRRPTTRPHALQVKRAAFAMVVLAAAAAAGALLVARHGRDDGPLAGLVFANDMTILSAQRVAGSGAGLAQLVVNWGRMDPTQNDVIVEEGLSLYDEQPTGLRYRRTYVLDPPDGPKQEHHPIGHVTRDLDGDGHDEILAIEDLDGSAGNRVYHLIGRTRGRTTELYRKALSLDDGFVLFGRDSLVTYEGVVRQPGDHGIHCCWSRYSRTVRKLQQGRLVVVQRSRTSHLPSVSSRRVTAG